MEQIVISCLLCSNSIFPTLFLLGAIFPILLALLLLHFSYSLPTWSNPPYPACFTPTPFLQLLSYLEQSSLSCSLYSNLVPPASFLLGANLPIPLASLQLHFTKHTLKVTNNKACSQHSCKPKKYVDACICKCIH